ncbi:MAG: sigma-70 family RNA polymerase sigma factor [Chitinophagaceae bacterium]|nr:sigma-70 family RNA polymerase sigma factor [Chitinophagaceae bacterium]MBP6215619.1 sigma-70 family RNA polymerase sigma factor [Chitinophagaceae bacterium]HQV60589.1 sigma-70 family RNA polymerase sigma factor [Chitinophagaceae bacterium]HQV86760.1 sigma-70 family RNA polymerase sigma factor [Chitinophagaceae bacterium]HQX73018.1 sigma-70 family RNA polymerase sigma factor [Chitinophagaceae bacterium]
MTFIRNISHSSLTDKELVALYKESGDMAILGELYQRYMELVYGVCLKYFKEPERSKDSVMLIFEELVTKLKKHEVENFRAWLHQLAKNHCLMQLRTPKNMKTVEFKVELVQSEENVHLNGVLEKEENFRKLEYCLGTLTSEQKESIKLFYLEGKSYNEIVDITGIEWNQVRSLIQNGRRNLKICMDKAESGIGNRE